MTLPFDVGTNSLGLASGCSVFNTCFYKEIVIVRALFGKQTSFLVTEITTYMTKYEQ